MLLSILTAVLAATATPSYSTTQSLTTPKYSLEPREAPESSQLIPEDIIWPPECATREAGKCLASDIIKPHTYRFCRKKVALTCWHYGYKVNMEAICKQLDEKTCVSCSGGINRQLYLSWISQYCFTSSTDSPWKGLPSDWKDALPLQNSLVVGSKKTSAPTYQSNNAFTDQFYTSTHQYATDRTTPQCISSCTWFGDKWKSMDALFEGDVSYALMTANSFPKEYGIGGVPQSGALYLDLDLFCLGWSWKDLQKECGDICTSSWDRTGFFVWLNDVCGKLSKFSGLPLNWNESVDLLETIPSSKFLYNLPNCLESQPQADCQLSTLEEQCTKTGCGSVDQNGLCQSTKRFDLESFCSRIKYGSACVSNCVPYWDRRAQLNWLSSTCGNSSVPQDWPDLLSIRRYEMIQWKWRINSTLPADSASHQPCPSATAILMAFAAVNLVMALLLPIVARRTVIKKLTFAYFGRQESRRWYLTGPLAAGLCLASNAVNAVIIKRVAGFEATNIGDLVLFWCTRPRIAWLVVALLPLHAERSMYFSATASTLFCEAVLQIISAYYMILGADFARKNKFLINGTLDKDGFAKSAHIMYSGSILWIVSVPFAIAACIWSILGVNQQLISLGKIWADTRKTMKTNRAFAASETLDLQITQSRMKPISTQTNDPRFEEIALQSRAVASIETLKSDWEEISTTWNLAALELRQQANNRRSVKEKARKARNKLSGAREGTEKWQQRWEAVQTAEQETRDNDHEWFTVPKSRQDAARRYQDEINIKISNQDQQLNNDIETLCVRHRTAVSGFEKRITQLRATIAKEDRALSRLLADQRSASGSSNMQRLFNIRNEQQVLVQTRNEHIMNLQAAENNPDFHRAEAHAAGMEYLSDQFKLVTASQVALGQNWGELQKYWQDVVQDRAIAEEKKLRLGHFPVVVGAGMMLCWIGQWLWWAGYVGLSGDGYCPPRLPALAVVWTAFSALGSVLGTSY